MHNAWVYSWAELVAAGVTQAELRRRLRDGSIWSVRRNWYAVPGADPAVVAAVRSGGSLTCVSALGRY